MRAEAMPDGRPDPERRVTCPALLLQHSRRVRTNNQWEYVDVKDFHDTSFSTRFKYCFVYVFLIKNIAIFGLDIFTATTMLATDNVGPDRHPS